MIVTYVPQSVKIRTYRGDSMTFSVLVKDDQGDPQDLTDWTFSSQIRKTLDSAVVAELSIDKGVGVLTVSLDPADSLLLYPTNVFDIEATKPNGDVWTILQGTIVVEGDVTRP